MQRARMAQIRRVYDVGGSDRGPRRDLRPTEPYLLFAICYLCYAYRHEPTTDRAKRTFESGPA